MAKRLPKGWKRRELGDLVEIESGGTPSRSNASYWGGAMPWITAKDLKTFDLRDSEDRLTDAGAAQAAVVPEGTLLVLVRGMGLFKDVPIGLTTRPMAFNQDIKALRPKQDLHPRFLGYALQAQRHCLMGNVDQAGHGTGRLATLVLEELPLPVPALDEQRRIVRVLDAADRQVVLSEQIAKATADQAKTIICQLIAGVEAEHVDLAGLVSRVRRTPGSREVVPLTISAEIGLVPQARFFDKRVASDVVDTYTLIQRGEFAYNKSYSNGYPYGAIKRLEDVDEGVLSSLYLCFRIDDLGVLDGDYLVSVCESGFFNRQIQMIAHEGARNHGLLNVSAEDFFAMKFPLPAMEEQKRIADAVRSVRMRVQYSRARLEALQQQKRGLMQKLLSGEWRLMRDLAGMDSSHV